VIPNHIVSQGPQAPYFQSEHYVNEAYIKIHKVIGHLVNFYNVNFFNQEESEYNTFDELFVHATGKP
jgi:hypothetical protein